MSSVRSVQRQRVVLDLKTSNQVQVTYFAQANFYWKAKVEEFPETKFDGVVILRLGKDDAAEFEPWFSFGDETHEKHLRFFKRALDLKAVLSRRPSKTCGMSKRPAKKKLDRRRPKLIGFDAARLIPTRVRE